MYVLGIFIFCLLSLFMLMLDMVDRFWYCEGLYVYELEVMV